jgi:hypothetical protein
VIKGKYVASENFGRLFNHQKCRRKIFGYKLTVEN